MSKREIISCFPEVLPKYLIYMLRFALISTSLFLFWIALLSLVARNDLSS